MGGGGLTFDANLSLLLQARQHTRKKTFIFSQFRPNSQISVVFDVFRVKTEEESKSFFLSKIHLFVEKLRVNFLEVGINLCRNNMSIGTNCIQLANGMQIYIVYIYTYTWNVMRYTISDVAMAAIC